MECLGLIAIAALPTADNKGERNPCQLTDKNRENRSRGQITGRRRLPTIKTMIGSLQRGGGGEGKKSGRYFIFRTEK